jgi:hypothetical protein
MLWCLGEREVLLQGLELVLQLAPPGIVADLVMRGKMCHLFDYTPSRSNEAKTCASAASLGSRQQRYQNRR